MSQTPITTFGPVIVAVLKPNGTGTVVTATLEQAAHTSYPAGSRPHFALQDALTGATAPTLVRSMRRTTQRFAAEVATRLAVGQQLPGHIRRTQRATPKFAGQRPAYEGGYTTADYLPTFADDLDLR